MTPRRSDFVAAFLRSFAIQGSWNYQTMVGGGLAFTMAPLLDRIHAGDPVALREAMERHSGEFNAHPYLASIAVGALARAEHERTAPETLERFRTALRAPLGALGDEGIWAGWRPFCALGAMIAFLLGLGPVAAAGGFLLVYNAGHVFLRAWGLRLGWDEGLAIGSSLRSGRLRTLSRRLIRANVVLSAVATVLLVARLPGGIPAPWVGGVAAGVGMIGYFVPGRIAPLAMGGLFLSLAAWLL